MDNHPHIKNNTNHNQYFSDDEQRRIYERARRRRIKKRNNLIFMSILIGISFLCMCFLCYAFVITNQKREAAQALSSNIEPTTVFEPVTEPPTEPPKPVTIDVCMIGDMLMHPGVYKSGTTDGVSYSFDHLFTQILPDIQEADIAMVNQETILGGVDMGLSGYPCFNSPQQLGDAEVEAGFDVILHATNHALDKGIRGLTTTTSYWRDNHPDMSILGIFDNEEASKYIYVYEKEGFRVSILNYTYGTNGIPIPASHPYCVNMLEDEDKIREDIRTAKAMSDLCIVTPHWGSEYVYAPTTEQKHWTNIFLEEGVDVVIGTHPHVLEPVELLTREDGHNMVVYYSLGNFISNQDQMPRMIGGMAKLRLVKYLDDAYIESYGIVPLVNHKLFGYKLNTTYKINDYTEELAAKNAIRRDTASCTDNYCWCGSTYLGMSGHSNTSFSLDYCKSLASKILGDMYNEDGDYVIKYLRPATDTNAN